MMKFDYREMTYTLLKWQTQIRIMHTHMPKNNHLYKAVIFHDKLEPKQQTFATLLTQNVQLWDWDKLSLISPQDAHKCGFTCPYEFHKYFKQRLNIKRARVKRHISLDSKFYIVDFILLDIYWIPQHYTCNCGQKYYAFTPTPIQCDDCMQLDRYFRYNTLNERIIRQDK